MAGLGSVKGPSAKTQGNGGLTEIGYADSYKPAYTFCAKSLTQAASLASNRGGFPSCKCGTATEL
jgi:hypothetical protein